jgi:small-conductance mechanosensitive channel
VRFDRAHFKEYGPYSLNFEIVYWVLNPDYNLYMDIQQAINLQIYKQFRQMRVEFAYPTQQLYFKKQADADDRPVENHIQQSQDRMRAEFVEQV